MTRKQVNHDGQIVDGETVVLNSTERQSVIKNLFTQRGWKITKFEREETLKSFNTVLTHVNSGGRYEFNVYNPTIRDESRNPLEKKIQLGINIPNNLDKLSTLIIGIYSYTSSESIENTLFVGYPVSDNINYLSNPSIRRTMVDDILLKTRLKGFYVDPETKYVGFTKDFVFYYLDNFKELHEYFNSKTEPVFEMLSVETQSIIKTEKLIQLEYPHQRIFFGAPGTGKSYKLNQQSSNCFGNNIDRVTFHPSMLYGDFVGTFKPMQRFLKDSDGNVLKDEHENIKSVIEYSYVPGILLRNVIKAFKNPNENFLLIVEEINRANVSSVYGDFFQLLDRDNFGNSCYSISTSQELNDFLSKDEHLNSIGINEKIYLPKNFYIWGTMNSADQGVMPIDTAFKRRWEFEYIGINDIPDSGENDFNDYLFFVNQNTTARWDDYRRAINDILIKLNIHEDKLLGPYFVSKSILDSKDLTRITNNIRDKVLMYIYEDAGKHYRTSIFSSEKSGTFSELRKNFTKNALTIFNIPLEIPVNTEIVQ